METVLQETKMLQPPNYLPTVATSSPNDYMLNTTRHHLSQDCLQTLEGRLLGPRPSCGEMESRLELTFLLPLSSVLILNLLLARGKKKMENVPVFNAVPSRHHFQLTRIRVQTDPCTSCKHKMQAATSSMQTKCMKQIKSLSMA